MSRMEKVAWSVLADDWLDVFAFWESHIGKKKWDVFVLQLPDSLFTWRLYVMARKPKNPDFSISSGVRTGESKTSWRNVKLEESEIALVVEGVEQPERVGNLLAGILARGADVSVKYQSDRKNFTAFIVVETDSSSGLRVGFSAYAPDGVSALFACMVKVHIWFTEPERFTTGSGGLGIG